MATKVDMIRQIQKVFEDNRKILDDSKISWKQRYSWLDMLETKDYVTHKRCTNFIMTRLLKRINGVKYARRHFDDGAWTMLRLISPNQKEMAVLRGCEKRLLNCWRTRPILRRSKK